MKHSSPSLQRDWSALRIPSEVPPGARRLRVRQHHHLIVVPEGTVTVRSTLFLVNLRFRWEASGAFQDEGVPEVTALSGAGLPARH